MIQVKGTFKIGKEESSESTGASDKKDDSKVTSDQETDKQTGTRDNAETIFGNFKSSIPSSKVSLAFQKLKEAKVTDFVKKGYDVVKDELYGNPSKRKHLERTPPPSFKGETSTRTDIVVLPTKQSRWSKKWEAFRGKASLCLIVYMALGVMKINYEKKKIFIVIILLLIMNFFF